MHAVIRLAAALAVLGSTLLGLVGLAQQILKALT